MLLIGVLVFRGLASAGATERRSALILFLVLVLVQLYAIFAPPPPNVPQMAVSLLVLWLALPGLAFWLASRERRQSGTGV